MSGHDSAHFAVSCGYLATQTGGYVLIHYRDK
jgi:hypothetical protein